MRLYRDKKKIGCEGETSSNIFNISKRNILKCAASERSAGVLMFRRKSLVTHSSSP